MKEGRDSVACVRHTSGWTAEVRHGRWVSAEPYVAEMLASITDSIGYAPDRTWSYALAAVAALPGLEIVGEIPEPDFDPDVVY